MLRNAVKFVVRTDSAHNNGAPTDMKHYPNYATFSTFSELRSWFAFIYDNI